MAKDPAILFYTSDFLTQTIFMSDEERGKYIKLWCYQHQFGHLDKQKFFSVCSEKDTNITKQYALDESGNYYNPYLEEIIIKRKEYSESRRKNREGKTKKLKEQ